MFACACDLEFGFGTVPKSVGEESNTYKYVNNRIKRRKRDSGIRLAPKRKEEGVLENLALRVAVDMVKGERGAGIASQRQLKF